MKAHSKVSLQLIQLNLEVGRAVSQKEVPLNAKFVSSRISIKGKPIFDSIFWDHILELHQVRIMATGSMDVLRMYTDVIIVFTTVLICVRGHLRLVHYLINGIQGVMILSLDVLLSAHGRLEDVYGRLRVSMV